MANLDFSAGTSTAGDGASNTIQNLSQSCMSSMEQFLTGIRIQKGHPDGAATPGFRGPDAFDETGKFGGDAVGPTIDELDPYFPRIFPGDDGTRFMKENDYRLFNHDKVTADDGDFNVRKAEDGVAGTRAAINVVQPMSALRGPIIISGWGFGMDDFPVPQQGAFFPSNTRFNENMSHNRALWKTGPVHLMWDDERQVWQGGYPIVCGVVDGGIEAPIDVCSPTSFTVNLLRNTHPENYQNLTDNVTPKESITVKNRDPSLEQDATANAIFCIAIKLNYEWLPLWVGCPEKPACGDAAKGQPPVPACLLNSTC